MFFTNTGRVYVERVHEIPDMGRAAKGRSIANLLELKTGETIAALIRDNKTFRIQSDIQTGAKWGMVTLDSFLVEKWQAGLIAEEEVITKSQDPTTMVQKLQEMKAAKAEADASGRN